MKIYTTDEITNKINKKNKRKKILRPIGYTLLIMILIFNSILILQKIANPEKTINFLGYKVFVIVSGSMKPEIDIGDMIIVKEVKQEDIRQE